MQLKYISLSILITLLISACVPTETPTPTEPPIDISAVQTAAAETVIANISATALAQPTIESTATLAPSPTIEATLTSVLSFVITPGPGTQGLLCDDAGYGVPLDVNFPDGSEVTAGQDFIKTWKIRNTGACSWGAGYQILFGYGDAAMKDGKPVALTSTVIPGQEVEVSVQFKAPSKAGEYKSWWRMANARAVPFGLFFSVWIVIR